MLILSSNNGGGHNSVARAVKELYESHGDTAVIEDGMQFLPCGWSGIAARVHSFVYRYIPKLFRNGYRNAEADPDSFAHGRFIRRLLGLGVDGMGRFIIDNGFDQVISCHVFGGIMLTDADEKYRFNVPLGLIETDYTSSPGARECMLDCRFLPIYGVAERVKKTEAPTAEIVVSGIPVRRQFYSDVAKAEAARMLGLREGAKNVLMACGSMGCGPMEKVLDNLVETGKQRGLYDFSVICGSNRALYNRLKKRYAADKEVHVYGMVDNMPLQMDAADVFITKPGGISVTEAAKKATPMILIDAVGGCEQYNLDYFVSAGGALTASEPEALVRLAFQVCEDEELYERMRQSLRKIFSENDPEKIYRAMAEKKKSL